MRRSFSEMADIRTQAGKELAQVLRLRKKSSLGAHYDLTTGSKTELGLYLTVKRLVEETETKLDDYPMLMR